MYNYTGMEAFRETSEYWYKVTFEKAIYPDGFAGYKHGSGMDHKLVNRYGLLEGVSGIGLSFISAISDIEPKWDTLLLLSWLTTVSYTHLDVYKRQGVYHIAKAEKTEKRPENHDL